MDHVILILSVVLVTVTGAGTAAAVMLHLRIRSSVTGAAAVVTGLFLVSLLLAVASTYLRTVLPSEAHPGRFFVVSGVVLGMGIYIGLFFLLREARRAWTALHVAALAIALVAHVGRAVLAMLEMTGLLEAIQLPAIAAISLFLLHAGIVCVVSWRRIESATAAALTRRLGVLLVVFAPLSTGIYAVLYTIPSSYRPPVSLDFVVALAWSFVLISAFVRYLNKPEMPLEHGVSPSFRAEYGITPREAEVISLVAEGLSNQQIADRLNVSFTTVRTHVYNVFRKTGSSSRMELVRLASSYPE